MSWHQPSDYRPARYPGNITNTPRPPILSPIQPSSPYGYIPNETSYPGWIPPNRGTVRGYPSIIHRPPHPNHRYPVPNHRHHVLNHRPPHQNLLLHSVPEWPVHPLHPHHCDDISNRWGNDVNHHRLESDQYGAGHCGTRQWPLGMQKFANHTDLRVSSCKPQQFKRPRNTTQPNVSVKRNRIDDNGTVTVQSTSTIQENPEEIAKYIEARKRRFPRVNQPKVLQNDQNVQNDDEDNKEETGEDVETKKIKLDAYDDTSGSDNDESNRVKAVLRNKRLLKRERKKEKRFMEENPRRLTLLERLLQPEIAKERETVLQCIRYIVKNNFFVEPKNETVVEVQSMARINDTSHSVSNDKTISDGNNDGDDNNDRISDSNAVGSDVKDHSRTDEADHYHNNTIVDGDLSQIANLSPIANEGAMLRAVKYGDKSSFACREQDNA